MAVLDTGKVVTNFTESYIDAMQKFEGVTYVMFQEPVYTQRDLSAIEPDFYVVKDTLFSDEKHTHWVVDNVGKREGITSTYDEPAILLSTLTEAGEDDD